MLIGKFAQRTLFIDINGKCQHSGIHEFKQNVIYNKDHGVGIRIIVLVKS